jgi:hypothetical protein
MTRREQQPDPVTTARMLIERHGLRAAAVAQEYASEAQLGGEAMAMARWQAVQAAIAELRRTAPSSSPVVH